MSRPATGQNAGNNAARTSSKRSAEADLQRSQSKKHRRDDRSTKQGLVQIEDALKAESESPVVKTRKPGETRTPPPDTPIGLTAKTHLVPPDAENVELRKDWEIDAIAITKNSTIKNAVVRTMAALMSSKDPPSNKKVVVALMARAESANTCISIVEIVKRELQTKQKSWFQYTGSWSRLETFPDKKPPPSKAKDVKSEGEEDDDQFQILQRSDRQRVRNIPCLAVYLSLEEVPVLRDLYG